MALPPAEELSRWTVGQVTTWLSQCSLTAFREVFLSDSIDGSKLMRLTKEDVDNKYGRISSKKRLVLKDHLDKLPPARAAPPSWANRPQLPPRTQGGARAPAVPPVQSQRTFDDDDYSDEDGWDEDFDDDVDEDYLEPTAAIPPPPPPSRPGQNNGQSRTAHPSEPQSVYEIPEETTQSRQAPKTGLARNETMVDRLRNELAKKRASVAEEPSPDVPPPRPPRKRSGLPPPPPSVPVAATPINNVAPPEDEYEITNDSPNWDNLAKYPWYHGKITRDLAKKIFEREQQDGMFLIRLSDRDPQQPYTLVIWHCNRIWNLPIRLLHNNNYALGKIKEGETEFSSLVQLVKHFKGVSLNLKSTADQTQGSGKLTVAAPKR